MKSYTTRILQVNPLKPDSGVLQVARDFLVAGEPVAFPTETVYGLGAIATDPKAVAAIYEAKGRPPHNPIIVHAASVDHARTAVRDWPTSAQRLADEFWPGPLTLVLPRSEIIPDIVTAGGDTVGIRVPSHHVARALIEMCGELIAAPSANASNMLSPTTAEHVAASLGGRIALILDGGPCPGGIESTVVDLTTDPPRLLRPGLIGVRALRAVLDNLHVVNPSASEHAAKPLRSPGQLTRHYSPRAKLELWDGDPMERAKQLATAGLKAGWIQWGTAPGICEAGRVKLLNDFVPADPSGAAGRLFAVLHSLDSERCQVIVVSRPPIDSDWLGVLDRLVRASSE